MEGTIAERLAATCERIAAAARRAGRNEASVRLVAVSKKHPPEAIAEAYAAGQRDFGENYPQELVHKAEALRHLPDLRWHMIGHVQRNKARLLVGVVESVETVDNLKLGRELDKRVLALEPEQRKRWVDGRLPVLIQVNIGDEPQKSGCLPNDVEPLIDEMEGFEGLAVEGLMCIPPHTDDPSDALPYFERLAKLRDRCGGTSRLPDLSMGMSADFEYAIAAGATLVRVGTEIFGPRPDGNGKAMGHDHG